MEPIALTPCQSIHGPAIGRVDPSCVLVAPILGAVWIREMEYPSSKSDRMLYRCRDAKYEGTYLDIFK
jgi:hypothetical protein